MPAFGGKADIAVTRVPIEMEGRTTLYFVTDGIESGLA
jgi:hypothetical protein